MMHPLRFLQSILARPQDDSPRLDYADWLAESGNPRGEFIRLQCLLAQPPVRAPHRDYERRSQELLAEFQSYWSQVIADRVDWCSFRRGFIEEISLSDRQLIRHADELFRQAPILDIHLKNHDDRLHELPAAPHLQHTLFLDVSSQDLGDEGVERLAEAPLLAQVHGLNLGSNHLGDQGLDALIESEHIGALRELYLNYNQITDEGIRRFVLSPLVERLDVLDVRFTRISREGIDVLKLILGSKVMYCV